VTENPGEGLDTIKTVVDYVLPVNVENLVMNGTGDIDGGGNTQANRITGNSGMNSLDGGAGSDTLDGGAGADDLSGGAGNDTIVYDAADTSLDGGAGLRDTLLVKGAGASINLNALAGDTLNGFEILDIRGSGNNSVTLSGLSVQALLDNDDGELIIYGNAGDSVNATDNWGLEGSVTIGGRLMDSYSNVDGAFLLIDHSVTFHQPV
jgi:RTX calcium-binding nonapeptide repeat (4 copies)